MKKAFLAIAILALAGAAQAQNTAQAREFRAEMCDLVATRGAYAFKFKEAGRAPINMNTVPETPSKVLMIWAINYGQTDATSVDNAYRVSQAKCMDNIDRVYRDDRAGRRTAESDLQ